MAMIGAFLGYRAYISKGPTITIGFETAEGLEAGKTKIRYLDVVVGTVDAVEVCPLFRVSVTVGAEVSMMNSLLAIPFDSRVPFVPTAVPASTWIEALPSPHQ